MSKPRGARERTIVITPKGYWDLLRIALGRYRFAPSHGPKRGKR